MREGLPEEEKRYQADRCREICVDEMDRILKKMKDKEFKLLTEAASTMRCKWLLVIP